MWLIIALAVTFSIAAAVWVGGIARENVLQQHIRRLSLETDQLSSDFGEALSARLDAVQTDPAEIHNLHGDPKYAALTAKLAARLAQLRRETNDNYLYIPTVPLDDGQCA